MYEFNAPGYYDDSSTTQEHEREELDALGDAIRKMWEWQWTESVDTLWTQAERDLEIVLKEQRAAE